MDIIFKNHGSVNKLLGDAILATFGCPYNYENDALNAVKTVIEIRQTVDLFNSTKPDYLKNNIEFGIGVATGNVFAGNIGSFRRMEYTVIGDSVNIASRLESLTKKIPNDNLIDGNTAAEVKDFAELKRIGNTTVRGKKKTVEISTILKIKKLIKENKKPNIFLFT